MTETERDVMTGDRVPNPDAVRRGAEYLRRDAVQTADEVALRATGDLLERIHETWSDLPVSVKMHATVLARALTGA